MWLKQYKEAVEVFNQLDSKCQLEENFLNIHEIANRNGKESIFEVQFTEYGSMNWGAFGVNNHWISSFGMPVAISGFAYAYADKRCTTLSRMVTYVDTPPLSDRVMNIRHH